MKDGNRGIRRWLWKGACAVAILAGMALAQQADAHAVSIGGITAAWQNATPSGAVTYIANNTANPKARWGTSTGSGQSGYNFAAGANTNVNVPPSPTSLFDLGQFTHVNQPITGNSITSIQLALSAMVSVDGGPAQNLHFVFNFTHVETPNGAPCPYGPSGLTGVNINGCADRVTVGYNNLSDSFLIGSDLYTLNISGFMIGGLLKNEFLTMEQANDSADLYAQILLTSQVVPEPVSMALLGAGLVGLGVVRRRRKQPAAS